MLKSFLNNDVIVVNRLILLGKNYTYNNPIAGMM